MSIKLIGADASELTLDTPVYGYSVDVKMALNFTDMQNAAPQAYDNGVAYDTRVARGVKFMQDATEAAALATFLNGQDTARSENIILRLGSTATGFYPFGPDLGDVGDFVVRVIDRSDSGALLDPLRWFEHGLDMVLVTPPAYTVPSAIAEGGLQIGSISALRPPQDGFKPAAHYGTNTVLAASGAPYSLDSGNTADWYSTAFDLDAGDINMGRVLAYITGAAFGRAKAFGLTTENNFWPFGADLGTGGAYTIKLMGNKITVTHDSINLWISPLEFSGIITV